MLPPNFESVCSPHMVPPLRGIWNKKDISQYLSRWWPKSWHHSRRQWEDSHCTPPHKARRLVIEADFPVLSDCTFAAVNGVDRGAQLRQAACSMWICTYFGIGCQALLWHSQVRSSIQGPYNYCDELWAHEEYIKEGTWNVLQVATDTVTCVRGFCDIVEFSTKHTVW